MQIRWPRAVGAVLSAVLFGFAGTGNAAPGDVNAGKQKALMCQGCHGVDGNSAIPAYPKLAGQTAEYIVKQLREFKKGTRKDDIMSPLAAALSEQDMANLGAYYASLPAKPGMAVGNPDTIALGKKIYRGGNAKTGVSACMSCHGPSGHGIPPRFPRVSGQHASYTEKQLMLFKNASRHNDDSIMTPIAFRMSEQEIRAVAQYMAGLH